MRPLLRWSFGTKLTLVFLTVTLTPIIVISIHYAESWEIVLIAGLISIIASLLLSYNISQPISRLTQIATLVKKNHAYNPDDLKDIASGHDEIARLARNFNEMVIDLRQREEKYRLLFENMMDSFIYCQVVFDKKNHPVDCIFLEINSSFEQLIGLTKEKIIGKKITHILPQVKETYSELLKIYSQVATTGKNKKFETYIEPLKIWLKISIYSPEKGYFVSIFEDITKHKQADIKLKHSRARYRELFDNINSGVIIYQVKNHGQTFIIKRINQAVEKIEKVKRKAVVNQDVTKIFPGIEKFGLLNIFKKVWRTGESQTHPTSIYKDKKRVGWRRNYVCKLPSGEIAAIYDDMTELEKLKAKLKKK